MRDWAGVFILKLLCRKICEMSAIIFFPYVFVYLVLDAYASSKLLKE